MLIEKATKQKELDSKFLEEYAKEYDEICNSVRIDNISKRNINQKESEIIGKEVNETKLNITCINHNDEMIPQYQSDKKNFNNFVPNENNIEHLEENDNTMNKTFKQFLEEIPIPYDISISSKTHRNKTQNKLISNENLQILLQSQVLNTNNAGVNNNNEHQREEFPDQNLVFSNVIKFEEKTNEEKDDLNNVTQVFVDKIFKNIKTNEAKETLEVKLDEQRFLEDCVKKRGKNNLMNISDNIYLESIDESKIHK